MHAARYGCIKNIPRELYHDATLTDDYGWTVAIHAARHGRIGDLPKEFYHDATF